jgi:hypothetical protein
MSMREAWVREQYRGGGGIERSNEGEGEGRVYEKGTLEEDGPIYAAGAAWTVRALRLARRYTRLGVPLNPAGATASSRLQNNKTINQLQLHQKQLNQMLLQPPSKCGHYDQACRIHYSTEPLYEPPLYHHHPAAFLMPPPQL